MKRFNGLSRAACGLLFFVLFGVGCGGSSPSSNSTSSSSPSSSSSTPVVASPNSEFQFSATRQSIVSGESTLLVWNVPAAANLSIDPLGQVQSSGSQVISPSDTTEYTLSGTSDGVTFANVVTVEVLPLADVSISASVQSGVAPLTVTFTPILASSTAINRIFWDFEGNGGEVDGGLGVGVSGFDRLNNLVAGRADYDVTGQDISFRFENVGNYMTRVRVLDVNGNAATATLDITVMDSVPSSIFQGSPNSGQAPLSVSFTYTGSDAQGIDAYEWDVDGDGEVDSTRSGFNHQFTEPGNYQPQLMITDRQGNTVTLSSEVLAISASEEPTPVVTLRLDNVSGEQPLDVDFSARVKHASRIGVSSWAWDFDGDGQVDSTSPDEASFSFEEPGIYFPRLEVVAEDGSVGFAIVQVEVLASAELLVSSNTLDPLQGETADFVLSLGGALQAKLDIVDSQKRVVRNLTDLQRLPAGDNRLTWDGKDNAGQVLPPGAYSPVVSFINGEEMEELSLSDETGNKIFYPSGWGGSCHYSQVECGLLDITPNEIEPFNNNPVVYTFDIPFNARMTAYVTVFGNEDFAPATFFRDQPLAKGSYQIAWFGEGTDGKFLPIRKTNGYVPAIFGITYPETTVMLTHDVQVEDLSVTPDILFPDNRRSDAVASYTFALSQTSDILLSIDNTEAGVEILRKTFPQIPASATAVVQWDGRDNTGELVAPGGYRIKVTAVDRYGLRSLPLVAMQRVQY